MEAALVRPSSWPLRRERWHAAAHNQHVEVKQMLEKLQQQVDSILSHISLSAPPEPPGLNRQDSHLLWKRMDRLEALFIGRPNPAVDEVLAKTGCPKRLAITERTL